MARRAGHHVAVISSTESDVGAEQLLIALRAAYGIAQNDAEREGVYLAAIEIAVKLLPSMQEYKAFLAAVKE